MKDKEIKNMGLVLIDKQELFAATELYVYVYKLPSGEEVVIFDDCTEESPVIYMWCLELAQEWLAARKK